eukprot:CAMPEP_0203879064 /NCGR_PEP_ID=MMETSP0359-20131031/23569_1 /ASSEMBLY_ACC=CAM_ASM_000338 /TAXON_ID=268821 /ORGANISM="Scrippsiella Hangoei, Strain SHTV-5" /LENGTH=55 /DNA_ID=CAMNT_0050798401 /DNA_START=36 /DNA_END=200 /DNA_ORIENTATION=+
MAWSFASLGLTNAPFLDAMAAAAVRRIVEFEPRNLSIMAWAFATLCFVDVPLFES